MTTVRDFAKMAFAFTGVELGFRGHGIEEEGFDTRTGKVLVRVDAEYFRPTEVDQLLGNPAKARAELGWEPKVSVENLCKEMVHADLQRAEEELSTARGNRKPVEVRVHEENYLF